MKFSLLFASIFVQAVLHKEFVGAKSDKLLVTEQRDFRQLNGIVVNSVMATGRFSYI